MANADPPPPLPKPVHPGERLASYFDTFFRTVVGVSTLGASITFAKIVSSPVQPFQDFGFSKHKIQWFLAVAWMLFTLALGSASFFASVLAYYRPHAVKAFGTKHSQRRRKVMWYVTFVSTWVFGLVIGAFIFVSLVVVGYAGPVGWTTVGFCIVFAAGGFGSIIVQSPVFMKREASEASETLSPATGNPPEDYHQEKGGASLQGSPESAGKTRDGSAAEASGYQEDLRYSRDAALRVQEFNNRWRKDVPAGTC